MAATKFEGWLGKDVEAVNGKMEWGSFEPKKWTEDDVDIEISHCGICGSDMHTLKSGWGPTPYRESCPRSPLPPPPSSTLPTPLLLPYQSFHIRSSRRGMRVSQTHGHIPPADLASST